jgi:hypothetical protein
MEQTMLKCRRSGEAFDFGLRIADCGLKDLQEVLRTRGSAFDFGFAITDCGLKDPRTDARTQSRVFDYPLVISTLPWFELQSEDKAPLNARRASNGEAIEPLNGKAVELLNGKAFEPLNGETFELLNGDSLQHEKPIAMKECQFIK